MDAFLQEKLTQALAHLDWLAVMVVVVLGALHALEPGHGKALLSIYFVGRRQSLLDILLLALVVTFTHTFSVIALGVAGTAVAQAFWGARLEMGLEIIGGLFVVVIGAVLWERARRVSHDRHFHAEAEKHGHDCEKAHGARSVGELLWLGVLGGLVPCPVGVVILVGAVTQGRIWAGAVLTLAFSVGVGLVIFGVGLAMWRAMDWADAFFKKRERLMLRLPQISAVIILLVGLVSLGHGLWEWLSPR